MPVEQQHQLDIIIDVKKPHWQIVQDILTLFKSAPIYSNGKYKIITDRNDLPVRQVFHAGNMSGKAEVRIAQDPAKINQVTAEYANRDLNYQHDVYVLQDSAQIFGQNAPIKNADTSLVGLTRPTEIARRLDFEMQRRQEKVHEITFQTGLEAIAVEPGDHCIIGVLMTDFEMGFGGRVLEGTINGFTGDREVTLNSGSIYDLWLWHTAADTPERRTVVGTATTIGIQPTTPFDSVANSGDRWALGVQSEDLILAQVKKVSHNPNGTTQIVANEYKPISIRQDCPNSLLANFDIGVYVPSQPTSVTATLSGCEVCFQMTTVSCQGGFTRGLTSAAGWTNNSTGTAQLATVLNNSIHPPVEGILTGNTISFVSGANSGISTFIYSYTITGSIDAPGTAVFASVPFPVASGTAYYVSFATSHVGYRVDVSTDNTFTNSRIPLDTFFGDSGCVQISAVSTRTYFMPTPITAEGVINQCATWVFAGNTQPCFDIDNGPPTSPLSITVQSVTTLMQASIPESLMTTQVPVQMRAIGLVNDTCDSAESTKVSFGLRYVNSTVIDSLVIVLRNAADSTSVGSNASFTLKATFQVLTTPTTAVRAILEYVGAYAGGAVVDTALISGVMSINFTVPQSMAFTVLQTHTDTTGAVHSHGCHSVVLDHGEFQMLTQGG